jgi:hypothetical protein
LGFKRFRDINDAMLMKLFWNVISKPDSFVSKQKIETLIRCWDMKELDEHHRFGRVLKTFKEIIK